MYWNGQVLRESCELMRAEHERQRTAEAAADCSREDCLRRREHAKMLQETVVELMRKQRDRVVEEKLNLSTPMSSPAFKGVRCCFVMTAFFAPCVVHCLRRITMPLFPSCLLSA